LQFRINPHDTVARPKVAGKRVALIPPAAGRLQTVGKSGSQPVKEVVIASSFPSGVLDRRVKKEASGVNVQLGPRHDFDGLQPPHFTRYALVDCA
jgi:hypothetical protein